MTRQTTQCGSNRERTVTPRFETVSAYVEAYFDWVAVADEGRPKNAERSKNITLRRPKKME